MPVRCIGREKFAYIPCCLDTIAPLMIVTGRVELKSCVRAVDSKLILRVATL
jgi:hypothetical protein